MAIIIITVFSPCMRVKCKDKQQVQNVLTAVNLKIGLVLQFYFYEISKTIKYLFFRFGNNVKWIEISKNMQMYIYYVRHKNMQMYIYYVRHKNMQMYIYYVRHKNCPNRTHSKETI